MEGALRIGIVDNDIKQLLRSDVVNPTQGRSSKRSPEIAERLAPFFSISHPARGIILGPYAKLEYSNRRLALDVAATVGSCASESGVREKLDAAVVRAIAGLPDTAEGVVGDGEYWAAVRRVV